MSFSKHHQRIRSLVIELQSFYHKVWFLPLVSLLAIIDNLILIIPVDGILISTTMLHPKRWIRLGLITGIGSTIGAVILFTLVNHFGLDFISGNFASITTTQTWIVTEKFFNRYGLYVVFLVSLTPFTQQPAIILAALGKTTLPSLLIVVLIGRVTKYLIMAYISSHAPHIITKMKWFKEELSDSGVETK